MKKMIITAVFAAIAVMTLGLQSCSSEESVVSAPMEAGLTKKQAPEVEAFKKQLVTLVKHKNDSQNKTANEAKAIEFKDGMTAASKEFLLANGVAESELRAVTAEEAAALRSRALRMLGEKMKTTVNN